MTKEFVPYELAVKLKQLGFDERCFKYEDVKKICENHEQPGGCQLPNVHCGYPNCTIDRSIEPLGIPIWQQAFRWFREEHDLHYQLVPFFSDKESHAVDYYLAIAQHRPPIQVNTFEEAELACLEKLIEIVEGIEPQK